MPDEDSTIRAEPAAPKSPADSAPESSSDHARTGVGGLVPFPPTRWTLVLDAAQGENARAEQAIAELCENYRKHGKAPRFERLRSLILEDPGGDEYTRAAGDLGVSVNALYQAVFRLRSDYYERFRDQVAQTVRQRKEELDEETRYLMTLV